MAPSDPKDFAEELLGKLEGPAKDFIKDPADTLRRLATSGQRYPETATKTRFGTRILVTVAGIVKGEIGGIQKVSMRQTRSVQDEFELAPQRPRSSMGLPNHITPGNVTSRTLNIDRYEIYREPFYAIFGASRPLTTLQNNNCGLVIRVQTELPLSSSLVSAMIRDPSLRYQTTEYSGCYFTDMGETYDVGNVIVGVNATMTWTRMRHV